MNETQAKVLEFFKNNPEKTPTIREICDAIGKKSTSQVAHHLFQLCKKGFIRRKPSDLKKYQLEGATMQYPKWINVKDLRPSETCFVYVKNEKGGCPTTCLYDSDLDSFRVILDNKSVFLEISHWIPLPTE